MTQLVFPEGFLWGTATSAQQIEGAVREGGRGESIWDRFASTPGKIADGSDPSVACDHYNRWRDTITIMHEIGGQEGVLKDSARWLSEEIARG